MPARRAGDVVHAAVQVGAEQAVGGVVAVAQAQHGDGGDVPARALAADEEPVAAELVGAVLEQPDRDGLAVVVPGSGTGAPVPCGTRG